MAELPSDINELKPDTKDDNKSGTGREALKPPFCLYAEKYLRTKKQQMRTGQVDMLE
jgi:hypothetical protein